MRPNELLKIQRNAKGWFHQNKGDILHAFENLYGVVVNYFNTLPPGYSPYISAYCEMPLCVVIQQLSLPESFTPVTSTVEHPDIFFTGIHQYGFIYNNEIILCLTAGQFVLLPPELPLCPLARIIYLECVLGADAVTYEQSGIGMVVERKSEFEQALGIKLGDPSNLTD